MKINSITRTETYIQLDGDNGYMMLTPASQTIFITEEESITVKPTASRKALGYQAK